MHPEKPVVVDSTACGRNFFARPSAPEYEEVDLEERDRILEEMKQLKATAEWYMHPEKPVAVDATACGRNYFNRSFAPVNEEEDEREQILAEMKELKTTADWYMHPEKPVAVDATACGRNYFSRPSVEEDEDMEEERNCIMEDMKALKMTAEWYMHPEKPVAVDSTICGRNYFSRPSAYDDDAGAVVWEDQHLSLDFESNYTEEMEEERKRVLAEANQLKEVASWYLQPEKPVAVDPASFGRNYFSRPSAPQEEDDDDMEEERERILEEMKELKTTAEWYLYPERPVAVDVTACGRNYFSRPSAPEYEEDSEEREQVLADAKAMKEVAGWYANPEQPVKSDGFATARNYFSRPSAPEQEDDDEDERIQAIAEAKELKEVASWYLQPEKPITVDPTAFGRNYFTRASVEQATEENEEERVMTLNCFLQTLFQQRCTCRFCVKRFRGR
jgi:hypothetical protein